MANIKIPQLGSAQTILDTQYLVIDDGVGTLKCTVGQLKNHIAEEVGTLKLTVAGISALPYTFSNSAIETDMVCISSVLSNPSAQLSDWTVDTDTAGSCVVSGAIDGSTDLTLYLMTSR